MGVLNSDLTISEQRLCNFGDVFGEPWLSSREFGRAQRGGTWGGRARVRADLGTYNELVTLSTGSMKEIFE